MEDHEERQALLALEDGLLFYGRTSSHSGTVCGEIVFNTSMTGYQEICTDPSYANQIVLFTTSHVGNVGVNEEDDESGQPWVKGIIIREMSKTSSNWRSKKSLITFLKEHRVPWIEGLDTRKLTRHLRENGTKHACMMVGEMDIELALQLARMGVAQESPYKPCEQYVVNAHVSHCTPDAPRIFIYDFGIKSTIVKTLARMGCEVTIVPHTMSAVALLAHHPDGIILSNGPGDPLAIGQKIEDIQKIIFSGVPVLGICLGCQLIALAAGGRTTKMPFGQHGANHPVYDIKNKKVYITSQNHHFVIDATTLPAEFEVTHICLFDGSVQGIRSKNHPLIGFQGHPEGSPGPYDIKELFEEFLEKVTSIHAARSFH